MRRNSLVFLLVIFFLMGRTQTNFSWFPVHPNTQNNYRVDTAASPITTVIKIDSISAGSLTYHFNTIITDCDTCQNSQLENDPFDSTYVLNNQPQFLNRSFIKTTANAFYFKSIHKRFVLCPFLPVGASWIYDTLQNINAALIGKHSQNVLGTNDSVCVIKLSTNDTIVLSKNSGIIQFPFTTNSHHTYKLVGSEGPVNAGVRLKRFHDFFNFQVGDVFQYSFLDNDYNFFPPKFVSGHERWEILTTTVFTDSIHYTIRKTYFDSLKYGGSAPAITAYTSTLNIAFIDSIKHPANTYPLQEIMVNPYFIYNNGIRHIHKIIQSLDTTQRVSKQFGQVCPDTYLSHGINGAAIQTSFANVFLNRNSAKIVGLKLTDGLGVTSELYNDYDRVYEHCLIGYVKSGDTTGVVYHDNYSTVSIKTNPLIRDYVIYPVPANNQVIISGALKYGSTIALINTTGECVLKLPTSSEPTQVINIAPLANGLYFIVISDQNFSATKKLVIQH